MGYTPSPAEIDSSIGTPPNSLGAHDGKSPIASRSAKNARPHVPERKRILNRRAFWSEKMNSPKRTRVASEKTPADSNHGIPTGFFSLRAMAQTPFSVSSGTTGRIPSATDGLGQSTLWSGRSVVQGWLSAVVSVP